MCLSKDGRGGTGSSSLRVSQLPKSALLLVSFRSFIKVALFLDGLENFGVVLGEAATISAIELGFAAVGRLLGAEAELHWCSLALADSSEGDCLQPPW